MEIFRSSIENFFPQESILSVSTSDTIPEKYVELSTDILDFDMMFFGSLFHLHVSIDILIQVIDEINSPDLDQVLFKESMQIWIKFCVKYFAAQETIKLKKQFPDIQYSNYYYLYEKRREIFGFFFSKISEEFVCSSKQSRYR